MQAHKKYFQEEGEFHRILIRSRKNEETSCIAYQGIRKPVDAGF